MLTQVQIAEGFEQDLERAIDILKEAGCTKVYLFGSLAEGRAHYDSDLDIAVRGCPTDTFYQIGGKLLMALDHTFHLIDLDSEDPFARYLEQKGKLLPVG
jgi:predicted nucleotidyltransferase